METDKAELRRTKNRVRMSNNRKLLRDMKLAISTLLPAPPAWRGEFGVAMGEPICPPLTRGEIPQAPPLEVHPLKWVGRSPVCPVDCAGLKEFIVACQAKLEYSILELLLTFEKERTSTIGMIREGSHKTCELDVSTHFTSEHLALELGEQLRLTLHISDKEADTCKKCAAALGVNVNGAFGVYCYNNITKVHGHILGVLNLLLSGTKVWYLWPPGPRPNENSVAATTIVQHAGQLLWLPPGWYHMVDTTGVGGWALIRVGSPTTSGTSTQERRSEWHMGSPCGVSQLSYVNMHSAIMQWGTQKRVNPIGSSSLRQKR